MAFFCHQKRMSINAYKNSREMAILSASPMQLVRMLYEGAIGAIDKAVDRLEAGDIRGRSEQITKACAIVEELTLSLDKAKGGELAKQLTELYVYIHQRLLEANIKQERKPLEECRRLLNTLLEAWKQVPDVASDGSAESGVAGSMAGAGSQAGAGAAGGPAGLANRYGQQNASLQALSAALGGSASSAAGSSVNGSSSVNGGSVNGSSANGAVAGVVSAASLPGQAGNALLPSANAFPQAAAERDALQPADPFAADTPRPRLHITA